VLRLAVPGDAHYAWLAALVGLDTPAPAAEDATPPALEAATEHQTTAIALARAARLLPAVLTVLLDAAAAPAGLLSLDAAAAAAALAGLRPQTRVSTASLPTDASEAGRVHAFRPDGADAEHYAIEIGEPDLSGPVTVRLHSACFTGDVLGSLKCDCGPQLRAAMATMAADGGGILLYLDQEGRGIGLANKLRAYALQDAGLDTVEANHWLGFEDDQRDFRIGAQLLRALGVGRVRLMTNNPAKVEMLAAEGIEVLERIPLAVGKTAHNAHYLATKAAKSGHLL
jgi:GTP cyclohydrolase II